MLLALRKLTLWLASIHTTGGGGGAAISKLHFTVEFQPQEILNEFHEFQPHKRASLFALHTCRLLRVEEACALSSFFKSYIFKKVAFALQDIFKPWSLRLTTAEFKIALFFINVYFVLVS